jgi:hypothetical protein
MPIIFYVAAAVIVVAIVAVNVWSRRLSPAERERLDAESQDDMRNFSM